MRYFEWLNIEHVIMFTVPAMILIILIGMALGYTHLSRKRDKDTGKITARYPDELSERHSPFPLVLILIVVGIILWAIFYILIAGLSGVKI
ncbi:MAG: hypothetical protein K9L30_11910 [Desulfobacterales bacterium]|nr:hypothetical protein [Desulfobacterales bacterium]